MPVFRLYIDLEYAYVVGVDLSSENGAIGVKLPVLTLAPGDFLEDGRNINSFFFWPDSQFGRIRGYGRDRVRFRGEDNEDKG